MNRLCGTLASSDEGRVFWTGRGELHRHRLASDFADMVRVFWTGRGELHRYRLASDFADMVRVFEKPALSEFYYFRDGGAWKKKPL